MKGRSIRARLDRLAEQVTILGPEQPECRYHGQACQLGAAWPLPLLDQDRELQQMIRAARIKARKPVDFPELADPLTTDIHEALSPEERQERRREAQQLLAEAKARVAVEEAEIINGGIV
ncbi:hypothetical protein OG883_34530 [Streptomyces sp. NBC_01142]|uniref:hypothetical protein n=1 Tax=Streptomyces sp. NBC_01142 TaxID=2975865 RepID=UPI00225BD532|nr:hypothetical protein [Streptomyces sp. NBC_01142]MCX4824884.1 hypothetical protein [Streptomyces sp. NBC_01142]